jgi:hypothetical protein
MQLDILLELRPMAKIFRIPRRGRRRPTINDFRFRNWESRGSSAFAEDDVGVFNEASAQGWAHAFPAR